MREAHYNTYEICAYNAFNIIGLGRLGQFPHSFCCIQPVQRIIRAGRLIRPPVDLYHNNGKLLNRVLHNAFFYLLSEQLPSATIDFFS